MSEKRFTMEYSFDDEEYVFFDGDVALTPSETAKLLNEQQSTNDYLEESNSRLQVQLGETLRLVDEQQSIIRKLQDLCGESDSENAKLRLKNKELQDKIDMLCEKYDYPKGVKNE